MSRGLFDEDLDFGIVLRGDTTGTTDTHNFRDVELVVILSDVEFQTIPEVDGGRDQTEDEENRNGEDDV